VSREGSQPLTYRIVIDSANDGSTVSLAASDRTRRELLHHIGFGELLHPF
jgi:hypothetical protein